MRAFALGTLAAIAAASTACRGSAAAFGSDAPSALRRSDDLFGALAARYASVLRTPKYAYARGKLSEAALIPSRAFGDTAVWTGEPAPTTRTLFVTGTLADDRYRLVATTDPAPPASIGDARHVIVLNRARENEYVWDTTVDFALGQFGPDQVAALFEAFWRAPEGRDEARLRAEMRAAFPRTAAALGRLYSIEAIAPAANPDGSTTTTMSLLMHPSSIEARFPLFAKWLEKYLGSAEYRFRLLDSSGAPWMQIDGADSRTTITFRSRDGRLAPLTGAVRALPDSLRLVIDYSMKVKIFRVGVRNMVTDIHLDRGDHERSVTFVARREPDWRLPLITERLIRSSLRYPFEGTGVVFSLAVRDGGPGPSLLVRRAHLAVQESGILRFLAGLASHTVGEFDAAEREQEVFLREVFVAMQSDSRSLISLGAAE